MAYSVTKAKVVYIRHPFDLTPCINIYIYHHTNFTRRSVCTHYNFIKFVLVFQIQLSVDYGSCLNGFTTV
jgi:hypothetical protein